MVTFAVLGRTAHMFSYKFLIISLVKQLLFVVLHNIVMSLLFKYRGHNGVKSAIASLKCDLMKRARIGIGRPDNKDDVTQYVLSKFDSSEIAIVRDTVERCCEVLINEILTNETK